MPLKKQYNAQAKKTATRYALANLCLHVLLLTVILQCVWLARMGVKSLAQAQQHIFFGVPAYTESVHYFFSSPKLVHLLSPFVWPYVPYIVLIVLASFLFSFKSSRALKRGRVGCVMGGAE
jgi:hypothetical protein